jgi:hypothetical protein
MTNQAVRGSIELDLVVPTNYLAEIKKCAKGRDEYDELLVTAIQKARDCHLSWERIGDALGVTRQAAAQRYSRLMKRPVRLRPGPRPRDVFDE